MNPVSLQYPRNRDVHVLFKGDAYPVAVSDSLIASGWAGGQGVRWIDSTRDEFLVDRSDGLYGGFLLWGSNEDADQYIGMVGSQQKYRVGTFCGGGWLIATRTFEKYTWTSRQGGPLVPITYQVGERLLFSNRGLFTNEDEWTLSGDPRGSNGFYIGCVVQTAGVVPDYITIQTSI